MADLVVAFVRSGTEYSFDYVTTLRNDVAKHLKRPHTMVCLTDQPDRCSGVEFIDITEAGLTGKWTKALLFEPQWRVRKKIICLDLFTVVAGDISPLADVPGEFAICEDFTRPNRYNSNVMVIGPLMGDFVWQAFQRRKSRLMVHCARFDNCIETLYQGAPFLQRMMPKGFFFDNLIAAPRSG